MDNQLLITYKQSYRIQSQVHEALQINQKADPQLKLRLVKLHESNTLRAYDFWLLIDTQYNCLLLLNLLIK